DRLSEELDTGHAGHALIDDQQRDRRVAQAQLADGVERVRAGPRAQDTEAVAVARAEVARDRSEHARLVIDDENSGLVGHPGPPSIGPPWLRPLRLSGVAPCRAHLLPTIDGIGPR